MPKLKGRVRKDVDGHKSNRYGTLKAGAIMDVELIAEKDPKTGRDALYFPGGVFEPEGWKVPMHKGEPNWYLTLEQVQAAQGLRPESADVTRKGGDKS